MIGRWLLAALLAGLFAGLVTGLLQHVVLDPIILQAEAFENLAPGAHDHDAVAASPVVNSWMNSRTFLTIASSMLATAGFSLIAMAISLLTGTAITTQKAFIWGLGGFFAFHLAPSLGLPPGLPGMPEADLNHRQLWWLAAVIVSAGSFWLLATQSTIQRKAIGLGLLLIFLFVVPFPKAEPAPSLLPAALASHFVTLSLGLNALLWQLITFGIALITPKLIPEQNHD